MSQSVNNFLDIIEGFHNDNRKLEHFARSPSQSEFSTMPLTAFVYQFFLYNSLYQVDWSSSFTTGNLEYHDNYDNRTQQGLREWQQQDEFESFICKYDTFGTHLLAAFQSLKNLELSGNWTSVVPDNRVIIADGQHFFRRMSELKNLVISNNPVTDSRKLYSKVGKCRNFVYKVRCNIFHGSKTLGDIHDPNQKRRIEIYFEFLHGLMSSFFKIAEQKRRSAF